MNGLVSVMRKEIMHLRRDRSSLVLALIIPMLQLFLFGYAIDFDVRHIPSVVVDQDLSSESRDYVSRLRGTAYIDVVSYLPSTDLAAQMLRDGRARVAVTIPPGFGRTMQAGGNPQVGVMLDGSDSQVSLRARLAFLNPPTSLAKGEVDTRLTVLFNPDQRTANFMVPGLMAVILQIVTVALTAFSVVREKEQGTLEQLMVTPVGRVPLMLGKVIPYAGLAIVELTTVLLVANFVFDLHAHGSLIALYVITIPFVLATLSLGLLISTISTTQSQALQLTQLTLLPSILLSGYVSPRETMPGWLYILSYAFPATHYIQVTRGVIVRGAGLADLMPQFFALTAIAAVLILISTSRFRKSLD